VYISEVVNQPDDTRFSQAISAEVEGLLACDVFEIVPEHSVPFGSNIMGSKFHLVVKKCESLNPIFKARLVIFGNVDAQKKFILSEAPTVSQLSIRMLISLSVVEGYSIWSRDIRQAFLQSDSPLSRTVYMRPPRQLRAKLAGMVFRVKKRLYGIVEAQVTGTTRTQLRSLLHRPLCNKASWMSASCSQPAVSQLRSRVSPAYS
jgi:Reverse transcriptase (RNA-dependent DNA polymerase)